MTAVEPAKGDDVDSAIALAAEILGPLARVEEPLGPFTTYRVGGPAAIFVEVGASTELALVSEVVRRTGLDVLVVGRGSNLLVADRGFAGIAVRLGDGYSSIEIDAHRLRAGGATPYPVLARKSAAAGLSGMEWAVGVPGSVGGAVRMNAGGHGSETKDTLVSCRLVRLGDPSTGGIGRAVGAGELRLGYRTSSITDLDVVVEAEFELTTCDAEAASGRIREIVRWRREHQPGGQNGGSVFTNPPGDSAGRLVEAAGMRGFRLQSAMVSDKHANFIQSEPGGSADDVRRLIEIVRAAVAERTGVELATELHLAGFEVER